MDKAVRTLSYAHYPMRKGIVELEVIPCNSPPDLYRDQGASPENRVWCLDGSKSKLDSVQSGADSVQTPCRLRTDSVQTPCRLHNANSPAVAIVLQSRWSVMMHDPSFTAFAPGFTALAHLQLCHHLMKVDEPEAFSSIARRFQQHCRNIGLELCL